MNHTVEFMIHILVRNQNFIKTANYTILLYLSHISYIPDLKLIGKQNFK